MTIALACNHIRKIYQSSAGPVLALDNVNVEIPANQFTAIVGPSGCGKSTLLHLIAGLDTDYEGEVHWHIANRRVGYLFQQPRLLPWMTVRQNVAFVLDAQNQNRDEVESVANRYLHLVGLQGFERSFPSQLSGGMQQRVAMARALAVEPEVILMDEPFGSLDELTARRLRTEMLRLYQENPRTVLFITHNVTEAAFLADRVLVMCKRPGHIITEIPVDLPRPRDYDDPAVAAIAHRIVQSLRLE